MDSPEGPSAAHFEHPASVDTFDSKQHARKQDIHMIPESAMLLSRLLEREARKQTVLRQIRPSTIRKPIREIPAVSCAKLLRKGTYKKTFRAPPSSKHRSTALSGRESGTSSFHHVVHLPIRMRLWLLFNEPQSSSMVRITTARAVSISLFAAVFVSTIVYILSTIPDFDEDAKAALSIVEGACMYMFTADFVSRFCCAPSIKDFGQVDGPTFRLVQLDRLGVHHTILPRNVPRTERVVDRGHSHHAPHPCRQNPKTIAVYVVDSNFHQGTSHTLKPPWMYALTLSAKPLFMLLFLIIMAMIVFSSAMYFAELTDSPKQCRDPLQSKACHPTQNPAANCCEMNPFYSIAATFWWCIVSMATVGYGDDYPVTPVGKFIATLTMMSGMLILALPISVIGSNFQHVMKEEVQDAMQKSLDTLSTLEVQFRRDLEALQKHNLTIALPPMFLQKEEQQKQRLSCASSIAEMRNGHHDPLAKQLEAMEEILEIRLLETEVRFENKLNALVKLVAQMEKKIAILRD
ncbi:hypothetical protein AaE_014763 [Aphanomyces astaci]|uniref:Ion transport domain-containing protein n=2 Tax=Aphanomyces astaci TaxID=112090 RepID=A0A6A4ZC60_APHAT|nr:hypothetical protein AaE_014763 [Aphanomyces astaci]